MLKYTVKPSKDTELRDFPIRELFISPDLSYISGVTDFNVGLIDGEQIVIHSPYLIGSEMNTINTQTVRRQGKVEVSIELPVKKIESQLNFPIYSDEKGKSYILAYNKKVYVDNEGESVISSITQNYVEYKGDICYFFDGDIKGYLVDHIFYTAKKDDETVTITTYLYIEDGKLVVGDYIYYADFSKTGEVPELKLSKEHSPIKVDDIIGLIDGCECKLKSVTNYEVSNWEKITRFFIQKAKNPVLEIDNALYGGYKHYVSFGEENYYLRDVYQYSEEENKNIYKGYGILLNDIFYEASSNYDSDLFDKHHDLPLAGSYLYVGGEKEFLEIKDTLISPTYGGRFILLVGANEGSDITVGNYLVAESNCPIENIITVQADEDGTKKYIVYEGKKYSVEDKLNDTINISGEDYLLTYLKFDENNKPISASTIINGETLYFDVDGTKANLSNKIYYKGKSSTESKTMVNYGINKDSYTITESSGVCVNGKIYPVITEKDKTVDEEIRVFNYVEITENFKITFEVVEINGSNTYIAYPIVDEETVDENYVENVMREYCNILVNNWKSFTFTIRKDTFARKPFTVENGLMKSMSSSLPYTVSDVYLLENKIDILRVQNYLSFKLPLTNMMANNIRREDILKNDFIEYVKDEAINTIVDMEKDVYYPVWLDENDKNNKYKPVEQLRFNLHFRTRNLENWKVYEDDREFKTDSSENYKKSNWFVTDLKYYKNGELNLKYLQRSSDLLGLLNFTTDEIRNQATKIGKSFLRLSFYSTNDPKTQVLLATSTIFLDENMAFKKYMNSKRNSDLIFINVNYNEASDKSKYQVSSNTISNLSEVYGDNYLNDELRLSSRFIVNNKYNTDTSSEGYYIYMFKDYAKKMRETTIYMKVDFNHAGIGQTISFMLPRNIGKGNVDGIAPPLYLSNHEHVKRLKNGFKLTDIYRQTHIPIKVIYDEETNRYVYYLPSELRENSEDDLDIEDEIMEFNLFEVKFANESIVELKNESNQ